MEAANRRICKSIDLAVSALRIGSESEMSTAAHRAGELARKAGHSLDRIWNEVPEARVSGVWDGVVDGWYAYNAA